MHCSYFTNLDLGNSQLFPDILCSRFFLYLTNSNPSGFSRNLFHLSTFPPWITYPFPGQHAPSLSSNPEIYNSESGMNSKPLTCLPVNVSRPACPKVNTDLCLSKLYLPQSPCSIKTEICVTFLILFLH